MTYNNRQIQKIFDHATTIFKEQHFSNFEPHLQQTICILLAFQATHNRLTNTAIDFALEERLIPQPIDSDT